MTFDDLNLNNPLRMALADMGISEPTAIQRKVFSPIMEGRDVVGIAQTGTGKTYAYLLPVLRLWKFTKSPYPQIMIVVPTRELVAQVVDEIEKLATYMDVIAVGVYGGTNMKTQSVKVTAGLDIVVGTPGRLVDLMLTGALQAKKIKKLIIDEVDEMLNLGFRTQLKNIIDFLPEKRQNLMFSATMTEEVEKVINRFTDYYKKLETAPSGAPLENIEQYAYEVPNFNSKANLLELLLNIDAEIKKLLVFVSTKKMADALYERMAPIFEEKVGVIHSSKSQNNRFATVDKFQDGTYRFIIATDIIARGLDVSSVTHIINFDLTDTAEKYIHRIGRTGRAEKKGIAISFVSEKEKEYKKKIEELMSLEIPLRPTPDGLLLSDELIALEKHVDIIPFNNHKMRMHQPSGPAFHDKKAKNKKVNNKLTRKEKMKLKYKKPQTRGQKKKRSRRK
ncbi:MAG TPA: DEAD/DEAH box helicase [Bacteroidetes bacterium]|nr:DEAD/DEAH box helicase [Bacteroidota bacterium]